jgi:phage virion morphogenesis protein
MVKNGISINWGGLQDSLHKAAANIGNTKQLMLEIGMAMKGRTVRRFHAGVSPEGEAWKEIQYTRKDTKGRPRKGKAKPLLDTGRLRNSISVNASVTEVHVGSNVEYARIHQLGGQAGRGKKVTIPARPYLGLSEEDQEEIVNLVKDHMEGSFD